MTSSVGVAAFSMLAPMLQDHAQHHKSIRLLKEMHEEAMLLNETHFREELQLQTILHKKDLGLERELHAWELLHDNDIAKREAIRDVWSQRNQHIQTVMTIATLMFACAYAIVVQGDASLRSAVWLMRFYALCQGISVSSLFICIWFCLNTQLRMSQYNIHHPATVYYPCGKQHYRFLDYFRCHCESVQRYAFISLYIGSGATVGNAALYAFSKLYYDYEATVAASVFVGFSCLALFAPLVATFVGYLVDKELFRFGGGGGGLARGDSDNASPTINTNTDSAETRLASSAAKQKEKKAILKEEKERKRREEEEAKKKRANKKDDAEKGDEMNVLLRRRRGKAGAGGSWRCVDQTDKAGGGANANANANPSDDGMVEVCSSCSASFSSACSVCRGDEEATDNQTQYQQQQQQQQQQQLLNCPCDDCGANAQNFPPPPQSSTDSSSHSSVYSYIVDENGNRIEGARYRIHRHSRHRNANDDNNSTNVGEENRNQWSSRANTHTFVDSRLAVAPAENTRRVGFFTNTPANTAGARPSIDEHTHGDGDDQTADRRYAPQQPPPSSAGQLFADGSRSSLAAAGSDRGVTASASHRQPLSSSPQLPVPASSDSNSMRLQQRFGGGTSADTNLYYDGNSHDDAIHEEEKGEGNEGGGDDDREEEAPWYAQQLTRRGHEEEGAPTTKGTAAAAEKNDKKGSQTTLHQRLVVDPLAVKEKTSQQQRDQQRHSAPPYYAVNVPPPPPSQQQQPLSATAPASLQQQQQQRRFQSAVGVGTNVVGVTKEEGPLQQPPCVRCGPLNQSRPDQQAVAHNSVDGGMNATGRSQGGGGGDGSTSVNSVASRFLRALSDVGRTVVGAARTATASVVAAAAAKVNATNDVASNARGHDMHNHHQVTATHHHHHHHLPSELYYDSYHTDHNNNDESGGDGSRYRAANGPKPLRGRSSGGSVADASSSYSSHARHRGSHDGAANDDDDKGYSNSYAGDDDDDAAAAEGIGHRTTAVLASRFGESLGVAPTGGGAFEDEAGSALSNNSNLSSLLTSSYPTTRNHLLKSSADDGAAFVSNGGNNPLFLRGAAAAAGSSHNSSFAGSIFTDEEGERRSKLSRRQGEERQRRNQPMMMMGSNVNSLNSSFNHASDGDDATPRAAANRLHSRHNDHHHRPAQTPSSSQYLSVPPFSHRQKQVGTSAARLGSGSGGVGGNERRRSDSYLDADHHTDDKTYLHAHNHTRQSGEEDVPPPHRQTAQHDHQHQKHAHNSNHPFHSHHPIPDITITTTSPDRGGEEHTRGVAAHQSEVGGSRGGKAMANPPRRQQQPHRLSAVHDHHQHHHHRHHHGSNLSSARPSRSPSVMTSSSSYLQYSLDEGESIPAAASPATSSLRGGGGGGERRREQLPNLAVKGSSFVSVGSDGRSKHSETDPHNGGIKRKQKTNNKNKKEDTRNVRGSRSEIDDGAEESSAVVAHLLRQISTGGGGEGSGSGEGDFILSGYDNFGETFTGTLNDTLTKMNHGNHPMPPSPSQHEQHAQSNAELGRGGGGGGATSSKNEYLRLWQESIVDVPSPQKAVSSVGARRGGGRGRAESAFSPPGALTTPSPSAAAAVALTQQRRPPHISTATATERGDPSLPHQQQHVDPLSSLNFFSPMTTRATIDDLLAASK